MIDLSNSDLNLIFDMSVVFMINCFLSDRRRDVPIDNETFLVNDFVNLKIKSVQYFKYAYRDKVYICVYMSECAYV
jgi:hypothetical protein